MAEAQETPRSVRSMEELASIMAANREQMAATKSTRAKRPDPVGTEDNDDQTPEDDAQGVVDSEEDASLEDDDLGNAVDEDDDSPTGDNVDDDAEDEDDAKPNEVDEEEEDDDGVAISEDDLVELEGLDEPVSIKQLVEAYTADKSLPDKMKQTEAYLQEASQSRAKAIEDAQLLHSAMQEVVKNIDNLISQPLVQKPNDSLKQSDPAKYIQQMEMYQRDQTRIANSRNTVLEAMDAYYKTTQEQQNTRKAYEISRLTEKLPELKDKDKQASVSRDILEAAHFYGFTPDEVNNAADHRLLLMAHDARQYRKLKDGMKQETNMEERETNLKRKIRTTPRTLRANGTTSKQLSQSKQRRLKVVKNRAATTGKPEDVAAFMGQRRHLT